MLDITNTNFLSLSNNPSRVDRLIAEYHYEYTRVSQYELKFSNYTKNLFL